MKNLNLYALANELNLGDPKSGTIRVPFGRWDFGEKKLADGRTVFFVQELTRDGAERMAAKINAGVADGEKGVPVYWGHPDVPELAHKYPDKRAKGWIKSASVEADALVLSVEWLEENATDGFGWFSPFWGGPAKDLGQGRYLKQLDKLTSVALVNIPNIQEFRLANELQGGVNDNERTFQMPQNLIDLARRFDERASLANEANYDESKHPRASDGKWTSAGGAGGGSGSAGKAEHRESAKNIQTLTKSWTTNTTNRGEVRNLINDALGNARKNKTTGSEELDKFIGGGDASKGKSMRQRGARSAVREVHKAAILSGFKYNRSTHQYE